MKVLDASVIISFYSDINRRDLLLKWRNLGHELNTPQQVYDEVRSDKNFNLIKEDVNEKVLAVTCKEDIESLQNRYPSLGKGELAVLKFAMSLKKTKNVYCCLDDKVSRNVAKELSINAVESWDMVKALSARGAITSDDFNNLRMTFRATFKRIFK